MSEPNLTMVKPRADRVLLTAEYQEDKQNEIRLAARETGCSALLVFQVGNIAYVSGLILPYAEQYAMPRAAAVLPVEPGGQSILILPPDWSQLPNQQNLNCRTIINRAQNGLPPVGLLKTLAEQLVELGLGKAKIGLDIDYCPESLVENLSQVLPDVEWINICEILNRMRMIKTDSEVDMLEEAVRQADRALVSAINHSEGCALDQISYSLWEFTERIRVHIGEFGGSAAGHLTTVQGKDMRDYSRAPFGNFISGNPVRTEATNHHRGYWADMCRTLFIGQPDSEFARAYRDNIFLKNKALQALRTGVSCHQVFSEVVRASQESGIDLWQEPGIGHGVGLAEREAPYLCPSDQTILKPGMVLALAVYTFGPQRELICSKDTYVITESGTRLLSWYRNWDMLYCLNGNTARHG